MKNVIYKVFTPYSDDEYFFSSEEKALSFIDEFMLTGKSCDYETIELDSFCSGKAVKCWTCSVAYADSLLRLKPQLEPFYELLADPTVRYADVYSTYSGFCVLSTVSSEHVYSLATKKLAFYNGLMMSGVDEVKVLKLMKAYKHE